MNHARNAEWNSILKIAYDADTALALPTQRVVGEGRSDLEALLTKPEPSAQG